MTASAFEFGPDGTVVDFYAHDGAGAFWREPAGRREPGAGHPDGDLPLPSPAPAPYPASGIEPRERRRRDLRAALTAAGVPPRPEDRDAIDRLSALPDSAVTAVLRWLRYTR
ncbi:hypothetical protein [Streptomyces sp. NPDC006134]|uniref:hypothetical protein n=1 Tax=Streptomyces sp. NPDC006134 TaxID=3154467 RepID=UPI0033D7ABFD